MNQFNANDSIIGKLAQFETDETMKAIEDLGVLGQAIFGKPNEGHTFASFATGIQLGMQLALGNPEIARSAIAELPDQFSKTPAVLEFVAKATEIAGGNEVVTPEIPSDNPYTTYSTYVEHPTTVPSVDDLDSPMLGGAVLGGR